MHLIDTRSQVGRKVPKKILSEKAKVVKNCAGSGKGSLIIMFMCDSPSLSFYASSELNAKVLISGLPDGGVIVIGDDGTNHSSGEIHTQLEAIVGSPSRSKYGLQSILVGTGDKDFSSLETGS